MEIEQSVVAKFAVLFPHLDERQRRIMVGAQARCLGRGGIVFGGGVVGDVSFNGADRGG